ncbi:MAG TPA: hypothetical protein VHP83_27150 [Aggregatilineaceae bacterium]|nr:hypothetical protein [Aggregatilineaceae bacterium]
MLPDDHPTPQGAEVEPISPQDAEVILKQALEPYLADGWRVLDQSAYYARLTRGMRNLDIRIDLLGEVETQDAELTPLQDSGRLAAWMLLLATILVVMALASALGII